MGYSEVVNNSLPPGAIPQQPVRPPVAQFVPGNAASQMMPPPVPIPQRESSAATNFTYSANYQSGSKQEVSTPVRSFSTFCFFYFVELAVNRFSLVVLSLLS